MSHENRHIILRQVVELELNNKPRGDRHAIAEETARLSKEVLPKIVDRSFSKVADQNEFLAVDLLEVELEVDSLEELEQALQERLPALLDEALRAAIPKKSSSFVEGKTKAVGHATWVLHFLEQGHLPWSAPQDLSMSQLAYFFSELLAKERSFALDIQRLLLKKRYALKRFLFHFGKPALWRVLMAIDPGIDKRWTTEEKNQLLFFSQNIEEEYFRHWQILLEQPAIQPEGFIKQLNKPHSKSANEVVKKEELTLRGNSNKEPIYLKNAGLILLHPFLNILLEAVGFVKDQKVTDLERAASLLHYLATGEEEGLEWDMVLPKILLGLSLEQPLIFKTLTKEAKQEAQQLLETVIQHWSVLGNTSADGFRESFLQRPGRLNSLSDNLYLKVEQRPYDLLLDQLPWGINYILLPWMPMPLQTEWV